MYVRVTDVTGCSYFLTPRAVKVDNTKNQSPFGNMDFPQPNTGVDANGLLTVSGWALDDRKVDHVDILVDIHCGGTFPWVDYCYVVNDEGLSRSFLSALLYTPAIPYRGTTATYAQERAGPLHRGLRLHTGKRLTVRPIALQSLYKNCHPARAKEGQPHLTTTVGLLRPGR